MMRGRFTFQISVDTASLAQRLVVGEAALKGRRLRARGEETRHRHRASDRRRSLNAG
jgi:hypothetical protein